MYASHSFLCLVFSLLISCFKSSHATGTSSVNVGDLIMTGLSGPINSPSTTESRKLSWPSSSYGNQSVTPTLTSSRPSTITAPPQYTDGYVNPIWGNQTVANNTCTYYSNNVKVWEHCYIHAGPVHLTFWPTDTNYSYPSTFYDKKLDYTYHSPSVYMVISTLWAVNDCGSLGPTATSAIFPFDLSQVSTLVPFQKGDASTRLETRQLYLSDLQTDCPQEPPKTTDTNYFYSKNDVNRCYPRLIFHQALKNWGMPYYNHCNFYGNKYGLYDPPVAIPPIHGGIAEVPTNTPAAPVTSQFTRASEQASVEPVATKTADDPSDPGVTPVGPIGYSPVPHAGTTSVPHAAAGPTTYSPADPAQTTGVKTSDPGSTEDVDDPATGNDDADDDNVDSPGDADPTKPTKTDKTPGVFVPVGTASTDHDDHDDPGSIATGVAGADSVSFAAGVVGGHHVSVATGADGSLVLITAEAAAAHPTPVPVGTIANQVVSVAPGQDHIVVGSQTATFGGKAVTVSDAVVSYGAHGIEIQSAGGVVTTLAVPTVQVANPIAAPVPLATIGTQVISMAQDYKGIVVAGKTVLPSGSGTVFTVSDSVVSVGKDKVIIEEAGGMVKTIPLPSAPTNSIVAQASNKVTLTGVKGVVVTVDASSSTGSGLSSTALVVGGQTHSIVGFPSTPIAGASKGAVGTSTGAGPIQSIVKTQKESMGTVRLSFLDLGTTMLYATSGIVLVFCWIL